MIKYFPQKKEKKAYPLVILDQKIFQLNRKDESSAQISLKKSESI